METLSELISRVLAARGETISAFAARIGVNRLTVNRWRQSLPAPETLRRVADDLDVPYSQILGAAMASAGYVASLSDLLAGQKVHIVTHVGDVDDPEDGWTAAAFVDTERATAYIQAMSAGPAGFDYSQQTAILDGAQTPSTIEVFTTIWSSRGDQIRQHSTLAWSAPTRLLDRAVTPVEATALTESDDVFMLQADSLDAEAGRAAIASALDVLRKQGRLCPPGSDPLPALASSARYLESLQDRYSEPQTAGGHGRSAAIMQVVPSGFAAARRSYTGGPDGEAVWPETRRFAVSLEANPRRSAQ